MNTDVLDDTLTLTAGNWGSSVVLDFTGVDGFPENPGTPAIEVTGETTQDAALRFRGRRVTVLNFASGVSAGGGVRYGALAQEEALCLCSGLLHGLEVHQDYYDRNREDDAPDECYDQMIWSEEVPLVRDGAFQLVEPFRINVITYPAPNIWGRTYNGPGVVQGVTLADKAAEVFHRRCRHVVRRAAKAGTEVLILGAWGCGAYGNKPEVVANAFKDAIATQSGGIERVVFAVLGGTAKGRSSVGAANRAAFQGVFEEGVG